MELTRHYRYGDHLNLPFFCHPSGSEPRILTHDRLEQHAPQNNRLSHFLEIFQRWANFHEGDRKERETGERSSAQRLDRQAAGTQIDACGRARVLLRGRDRTGSRRSSPQEWWVIADHRSWTGVGKVRRPRLHYAIGPVFSWESLTWAKKRREGDGFEVVRSNIY